MRQSLSFILPVGLFLLILLPYLHYVPMWDSAIYISQCVLDAVSQPFDLMAFNCSNHNSLFFAMYYSVGQYISYGNSLYVHISSFLLLVVGFYFYHAILKYFTQNTFTITLGMLLLCCNPAVIANAINPSPDLAVMVMSIIVLWALLVRRSGYAVLAGTALVFSKESGLIFYILSCALYVLFYHFSLKRGIMHAIRRMAVLSIPLVLYALFVVYKTQYGKTNLLFENATMSYLLKQMLFLNPSSSYDSSAFLAAYVINFQWVIAAGLVIGVAALSFKRRNEQKNFLHPFGNRDIVYVLTLTLLLSYVLSRYPHFLNIRYYLVLFPLTTLLFIYIWDVISLNRWRLVVSALIPLFIVSCFYTIDPVSRALFGTFDFGNHQLLNMTSHTGECCGYGRDQLVYNLQHTELEILLRQFARQAQVNKDDVIIANFDSDFYVFQRMANQHYEKSLCLQQANSPIIGRDLKVMWIYAMARPNVRFFYPQLPNLKTGVFTQELLGYFRPVGVSRVTHHGYELAVLQLEA